MPLVGDAEAALIEIPVNGVAAMQDCSAFQKMGVRAARSCIRKSSHYFLFLLTIDCLLKSTIV